jgi:N-acetylglucosaminyl-diphospho-decaprenol L-rhamnosyltransferase
MKLDCSIVIPTYYPGKIIINLFESIPKVKEILVLDNSNDRELKSLINLSYKNIKYTNLGDIGLSKTFNYALKKTKSNNIFITQPDVILRKNCVENLIKEKRKYFNAAILSPLVFYKKKYCYYDAPNLEYDNNFKLKKTSKKISKQVPKKNITVEAVTSTAILIDKLKIAKVGGWDNYYYTYLEDIDLSLNVRKNGFKIYKIKNSIVDHTPFSSHKKNINNFINLKRIRNFTRSSLYFKKKHSYQKDYLKYYFKNVIKIIFKVLIYSIIFHNKKSNEYLIKLKEYLKFYNLCVSKKI